jgi:Ca-activated chloride channel homolog
MSSSRIQHIAAVVLANAGVVGFWFWVRNKYEFADPHWFWLLLLVPAISIWSLMRPNMQAEVKISTLGNFSSSPFGWLALLRNILIILRAGGIALLVIALARPQSKTAWQDVTTEGIDIVISFDVSASMLAKDFEPTRWTRQKTWPSISSINVPTTA